MMLLRSYIVRINTLEMMLQGSELGHIPMEMMLQLRVIVMINTLENMLQESLLGL